MVKHQASSNITEIQSAIYQSKNPVRFYLHNSRKEWLIEKIHAVSNPGFLVLEIGVGSGQYSALLAKLNQQLHCFDIEEKHLTTNKKLFAENKNILPIQGDITKNSFPDNSFDLIVFSEVLEHIPDSEKALQEIVRILKPGGQLLLTTPQKYSLVELCGKIAYLPGIIHLLRFIYKEPVEKTGHISLYTEKRLKHSFNDKGLTIIQQYKLAFYLPVFSELGGNLAAWLCKKLENTVRNTPLDVFCWTQCYILEKPHKEKQ